MVKAYLRYVQERVFSGLSGAQANIKVVQMIGAGNVKTYYAVSACNEVVNLTNIRTGEVIYQIYDREAIQGTVTCLAVAGQLLAIGYSSGTIMVYNLAVIESDEDQTRDKLSVSRFELAHQFSFHKTAVTCMEFSGEGTT